MQRSVASYLCVHFLQRPVRTVLRGNASVIFRTIGLAFSFYLKENLIPGHNRMFSSTFSMLDSLYFSKLLSAFQPSKEKLHAK